jgi:hypothetical protein
MGWVALWAIFLQTHPVTLLTNLSQVSGFHTTSSRLFAPKLCDNVDDAIKDIKVVFALYVHSFELHTST